MSEETDNTLTYPSFRLDYEQRFPSKVPKRRVVISAYPGWLAPVVFLMFASAAVLSGVHTIPTVYATIEDTMPEWVRISASAISFIAVEIAIFTSAYLMLTKDSRAWARWLLILTGAVAVIANLYSSSKAFAQQGDAGVILVAYLMGFCMPLIALVSGKLFVNIHRAARQMALEVEQDYQGAMVAFDELVNIEYEKEIQRMERRLRRLEKPKSTPVNDVNLVNLRKFTTDRPSKKLQDTIDWLKEHPEHLETSSRELVDQIGVSHMTIFKAQELIKSGVEMGEPSTNGHNTQ